MTKSFQKLLGHHFSVLAAFDASFCNDEHIVFSNFLFDSNPPFSHRHYYERIERIHVWKCVYEFIYYIFFKNLLARNPFVWWIHVCGNLDILVFFFLYTYIAASLRWCAFPIKHSKFIWFKRGIFSFFNILEYYTIVNLCGFLLFCVLVVIVPELILVIWKKTI